MYTIGWFTAFLMVTVQGIVQKINLFSATRTMIPFRIYLEPDATVREITVRLKKLGLESTDHHISTAEDGTWKLDTNIVTMKDVSPRDIQRELEESPKIRKAEIR
jgi:hypothetical protein